MMHILFLNHNIARRGGTFYRAYHAGRYLARRGHTVTLLTISAERRQGFDREISEGVEIIHTPDLLNGIGRTGWDPWDTLQRVSYLHGRQWDIIHAWDCRPAVILPALYARTQSRQSGGRLVVDWCDWWGRGGTQAERPGKVAKMLYGPLETFFEEAFRTQADGTTVASAALRDRALRLGVAPEPLMILPGGSDTETIQVLDKKNPREKLGISPDTVVIGYMGAITLKETKLLIESIEEARKHVPNLMLLAVGTTVAGSALSFSDVAGSVARPWLRETGRIPFSEVGYYLAACDAFVLPLIRNISNTARWPSKLNDYLAVGRPIVATRVGDIATYFQRYSIGITTDDHALAFARGMVSLIQQPALANYLGDRARQLAEEELNWTTLISQLEAFYKRVRLQPTPSSERSAL